jgi:hypothetical protein
VEFRRCAVSWSAANRNFMIYCPRSFSSSRDFVFLTVKEADDLAAQIWKLLLVES